MALVPTGVAARGLRVSRERLVQLANAGRVRVVRDSTGRRFLEPREVDRLRRARQRRRRAEAPASAPPGDAARPEEPR